MPLQERRINYLPFEYPWADEAYEMTVRNPWFASEVNMGNDVMEWENILSEQERTAVGRILSSFTYMEQGVGDYWSGVVAAAFPKPEIWSMAIAFAQQEANHVKAYNHLSATLGLDEYQVFLGDPDAQARVSKVLNYQHRDSDLLTSLATFSGLIEGVSLYSSFAVLLSFCQPGIDLLKGLRDILGWSVQDERNHSAYGIRLFKELVAETGPLTRTQKKRIYDAARDIVSMEETFINNIFAEGDLRSVGKHAIYSFILQRANTKLTELGLKPIFRPDHKAAEKIGEWFYPLTESITHGDFFVGKNGGEYTAHNTQDFSTIDYASLLAPKPTLTYAKSA